MDRLALDQLCLALHQLRRLGTIIHVVQAEATSGGPALCRGAGFQGTTSERLSIIIAMSLIFFPSSEEYISRDGSLLQLYD